MPLPIGPGRALVALAAAAALASGMAGCSSSLPKTVSAAPVLSVATGLWPLAQAAASIGGDKAAVVDVVPAGTDPLRYQPDAAAKRILQSSGLVLEIGGGFQAGLEAASAGATRVLRLGPTAGATSAAAPGNPYVWLDPAGMGSVVRRIAGAMAQANPAAAALYQRNAGALQDEIRSVDIDYSSTLSTCPGTVIITPDGAFSSMAASYGLKDHIVGTDPTPERIAAETSQIQSGSAVAILSETWVDDAGVRAVAAAAGAKVRNVDTLAGTPVNGTAVQNTYVARMEQILGIVSGGLGCNASEQ